MEKKIPPFYVYTAKFTAPEQKNCLKIGEKTRNMNVGWLKSFLTIEDIMNAAQGISFKIYEFHQRRIYIYESHNEKVLYAAYAYTKKLEASIYIIQRNDKRRVPYICKFWSRS